MALAINRETADHGFRIVIVDDSALARLMLRDALTGIEGVRVVGNAAVGSSALEVIDAVKPDLIILDVEMPGMNGLEMLREMNFRGLDTPVLMCSRLTSVGAEVTTEALLQGAYDVVCKPCGRSRKENVERLRCDLTKRITPLLHFTDGVTEEIGPVSTAPPQSLSGVSVDAILIGASTGGPVALHTLLGRLDPAIHVPVFIVQHIPRGFSQPLARRLGQESNLRVVEACDGAVVSRQTIYLARGGQHLTIQPTLSGPVIKLVDSPPVNGCRPSVDVMLNSALHVYGKRCLVVILTGMGRDGAAGARVIRAAGGIVFAQHPESCTVSSMPRQTISAAGADRIAGLEQLAELINSLATRG